MGHSMGRRSYAQLHYLELQKNPEVKRSRVDDWKKGHVRADGTVLESAREKYKQVEVAEERMASSTISEEGSNSQVDINSDALSKVFGLDPTNRVRGVGSNCTKKQYHRTAAAKAILEEVKNVSVAEVKTDVANVKTDVAGVKTDVADMKSMMETMLQHMSNLAGGRVQLSPMMPSPSVEVGSNSQRQTPIAPQNLAEMFDSVTPNSRSVNRSVILFNNNDVAVAKGHIDATGGSQICHNRKVRSGEKKVYITEVYDPNAPIYDGPQNGETTLLDFVAGGFLIWTESRMQPCIGGDENV